MRVLVADDDPVSQRILLATLTHLGHEAAVADDGQAAWERFTAHPTDAVITDWMMPRIDGLELTRRIRARPVDAVHLDRPADGPYRSGAVARRNGSRCR